jgi:hypothetical protein
LDGCCRKTCNFDSTLFKQLPINSDRITIFQGQQISRRRIIGFVYGDSRRLKYFYEAKFGRTLGSFRGLIYLLAIGGRGSLRNVAGIARIFLDFAAGLIIKSYKSISYKKEARTPP